MKTSTHAGTRSAMSLLAGARPPVADNTEGIVPRAERARLLRSIVEPPTLAPPSAPTPPPAPVPSADRAWVDATNPVAPRRRLLAGALVAAVVVAGLAVAGLVGTDDELAQVNAGVGNVPRLPALAPDPPATSFALTGLPEALVLQEVSVEPAGPPLPGSPHADVYGRMSPDGTIEAAIAVITATAPDFVDVLLREGGATSSPVPDQAGQLDIDFGQGLVARSFATADGLTTMVLGRGLEGGATDLPGIIDDLVRGADGRMETSALDDVGFKKIYEGDQVPGLSPGPRMVLRYGDGSGERGVTLSIEEGRDFAPASFAWRFPVSRSVQVRGYDGVLVADDLITSVTWQEGPGPILSLDVKGFTQEELLAFANGVEEVSEAPWLPTTGVAVDARPPPGPMVSEDSVTSNSAVASGPEVVLGEGRAGDQRWQLIGYEVEPASGTGSDLCIELRGGGDVPGGCYQRPLEAAPPLQGSFILDTGPDLGGHAMVRGDLDRRVATVRFLLDNGETLDVATVSHERFGTHVAAALPQGGRGATVVLLDEAGSELQRQELPSSN